MDKQPDTTILPRASKTSYNDEEPDAVRGLCHTVCAYVELDLVFEHFEAWKIVEEQAVEMIAVSCIAGRKACVLRRCTMSIRREQRALITRAYSQAA